MGTSTTRMSTDKQARAIMEISIGRISHDLANSINQISNTVQLLEGDALALARRKGGEKSDRLLANALAKTQRRRRRALVPDR